MKTDWNFSDQGTVDTDGGKIWYGLTGNSESSATALIAIHGGPGMTHDYLYPLTDLADERQVIFYDQLDAGLSERPNDPGNWSLARFLNEIDDLRDALNLPNVAIFGNSWGCLLYTSPSPRDS